MVIPKKIVIKTDINGNVIEQDIPEDVNLQEYHRELEVDVVMSLKAVEEFLARLTLNVNIMKEQTGAHE